MENAPAASFAALLRRHRVATGLSQEALAERAGLSVRAISDLERGARRAPYRETVRLLADALALVRTPIAWRWRRRSIAGVARVTGTARAPILSRRRCRRR